MKYLDKTIQEIHSLLKEKKIYENTRIHKIKYSSGKYHCFTSSNKFVANMVR